MSQSLWILDLCTYPEIFLITNQNHCIHHEKHNISYLNQRYSPSQIPPKRIYGRRKMTKLKKESY